MQTAFDLLQNCYQWPQFRFQSSKSITDGWDGQTSRPASIGLVSPLALCKLVRTLCPLDPLLLQLIYHRAARFVYVFYQLVRLNDTSKAFYIAHSLSGRGSLLVYPVISYLSHGSYQGAYERIKVSFISE